MFSENIQDILLMSRGLAKSIPIPRINSSEATIHHDRWRLDIITMLSQMGRWVVPHLRMYPARMYACVRCKEFQPHDIQTPRQSSLLGVTLGSQDFTSINQMAQFAGRNKNVPMAPKKRNSPALQLSCDSHFHDILPRSNPCNRNDLIFIVSAC